MALVELRGLTKRFGATEVVADITMAVDEGEFVVVLGPSGCGKSTLLRMIAGLEEASAGEIRIDGRRVDALPPKARGCAMVFQNYALYPHLTVRGNIGYGLRVAGMPRPAREARIGEVARLLEIGPLLDRRPGQLSGGQRQRVAIARAIAREPRLFLFDEPLSNLDARLRTTMRTELRRLHDRIGATSLFVTHDQVEAMTLGDRIVVLNGGRIAQFDTPGTIYRRPADLFVAGFIGTPPMNLIAAEVTGTGITLANGWVLPPLPGAPQGAGLTLGIRPEDIATGGPHPATVAQVEDLGPHRLLHCRAGGLDLAVAETAPGPRRRDETLGLALPPQALSLFDPQGRRCWPPLA